MAKLIKLVNKEYARLLDRMYKDVAYIIVQQDANGIVLKAPDYFAEFMARSSGTNKIFLDSEYSFSKATQSSVADILYNFSRVVSITSSGNNATVYVDIANLKTVTPSGQTAKKWFGVLVTTNYDSIVGATLNGVKLTQTDADAAIAAGGLAGSILIWVDGTQAKTFTYTVGFPDSATTETISISVVNKPYYSITTNLNHVVANANNAVEMLEEDTKTLLFTAAEGYWALPDTITVVGATGLWNKSEGSLRLSNVTGNITITITAVDVTPVYSIQTTLDNVIANQNNPTTIKAGETKELLFEAESGYDLPNTVAVEGASHSWESLTGMLTISNPTGTLGDNIVTITIRSLLDFDDDNGGAMILVTYKEVNR